MNRRILSATMVALLVFLTCVPAFANTRSSVMKVNASGETYGTLSQQGEMPDLIAAVANNGKKGYIKKTDVEANSPTCPADAVRKMEKMERAGDRTIPVYKADGITIIGDFTIENTRKTSIEIVEPAVSVASTTTSAESNTVDFNMGSRRFTISSKVTLHSVYAMEQGAVVGYDINITVIDTYY